MGSIDLDPCSEFEANLRLGADAWLEDYKQPWYIPDSFDLPIHLVTNIPSNIFVNPPGGKTGNKSNPALVWEHAMTQLEAGNIKQMFFLAFSVEALQVTQGCTRAIADFPVLYPPKRLAFIDGDTGKPVSGNTHASALVYVPGTVDNTDRFIDLADGKLGKVQVPAKWYQRYALELEAQTILAKSSCSLMVA